MDEEDNNPGNAQIPLINDLVFDESLPLKAPPKKRRPAVLKRKSKSIPLGYDPDTGDLFGGFDDDFAFEDKLPDLGDVPETGKTLGPALKAELKDELESVLKALNEAEDGQP